MGSRRWLVWIPVALAGGLFAGSAWAVVASPELVTADTYYSDSMSLQEIASAATGSPGEIAPPCPKPEKVDELKKAGIPFGPCDPVPERGELVLLPEAPEVPSDEDVECPMIIGSKANHDLNVGIACASGARLLDWIEVDRGQEACIQITYLPSSKAEVVTEALCPGDVPSVGGTPMGLLDQYTVSRGEWVRGG